MWRSQTNDFLTIILLHGSMDLLLLMYIMNMRIMEQAELNMIKIIRRKNRIRKKRWIS